jgi:hypothetical protein
VTQEQPASTIDLYREIYRRRESGDASWQHYGSSCHGGMWLRSLVEYAREHGHQLLDVGCGTNEWGKAARTLRANAVGIDPGNPPGADEAVTLDEWLAANELALPLVTAWDVLEHLDEADASAFADSVGARCAGFVGTIATTPSLATLDGRNLHETVRDADWWVALWEQRTGWKVERVQIGTTLVLAAAVPLPEARRRLTVTEFLGDRYGWDEIGDMVCGQDVDLSLVRDWASGFPGAVDLTVIREGEVDPDRHAQIEDAAVLGRSDSVTSDDVGEAQVENIATNAGRTRHGARPHDWAGRTVVIVGAGPSLTPDVVAEIKKHCRNGGIVLATDRAADLLDDLLVPWVTLEPRPVKLTMRSGVAVAHVVSHPERTANADVTIWLQEYLCERDDVPGWVPEVPGVRHVTALAVWYARLCRARRVVLVGCDYCYGADGSAYADGAAEDRDGSRVLVACGDGERRPTRGDWRVNLAEMARCAARLRPLGMDFAQASGMTAAALAGWEHFASLAEALAAEHAEAVA